MNIRSATIEIGPHDVEISRCTECVSVETCNLDTTFFPSKLGSMAIAESICIMIRHDLSEVDLKELSDLVHRIITVVDPDEDMDSRLCLFCNEIVKYDDWTMTAKMCDNCYLPKDGCSTCNEDGSCSKGCH
jgi:hypothetical protein